MTTHEDYIDVIWSPSDITCQDLIRDEKPFEFYLRLYKDRVEYRGYFYAQEPSILDDDNSPRIPVLNILDVAAKREFICAVEYTKVDRKRNYVVTISINGRTNDIKIYTADRLKAYDIYLQIKNWFYDIR